ncbi:MAG: ATP synthase F1 subunit epsilon [Rickettsiales bacterium]
MSNVFHLHIVSPAQSVLDTHVEMVEIPGLEGDFGVLPDHAPFFSMLRPGVISVYLPEKRLKRLFATSGYAEVSPEGCTVISDDIHDLESITLEEAKEVLERAEHEVNHAHTDSDKAKAAKRMEAAKALVAAL